MFDHFLLRWHYDDYDGGTRRRWLLRFGDLVRLSPPQPCAAERCVFVDACALRESRLSDLFTGIPSPNIERGGALRAVVLDGRLADPDQRSAHLAHGPRSSLGRLCRREALPRKGRRPTFHLTGASCPVSLLLNTIHMMARDTPGTCRSVGVAVLLPI